MTIPGSVTAHSRPGAAVGRRGRLLISAFLMLLLAVWCHGLTLAGEQRIRESALAGTWYPRDPETLRALVDGMLDDAATSPGRLAQPVRALIVPHAGYRYSGPTAAEGFALLRGKSFKRVMILAPAHRSGFSGLSVADVDYYRTPLGDIPIDNAAVARLRESGLVSAHPFAHLKEHSIEIELPMLQRALEPGWKLVPVLVGRLRPNDYRGAARALRPLADQDTLVLVSSDFAHYGARFDYQPFPPDESVQDNIRRLDAGALSRILEKDRGGFLQYRDRTGITICGFRPIRLMLEMLPDSAQLEHIAYRTSGELTGEWANSVSYAVVVVSGPDPISTHKAIGNETIDESAWSRLHELAVAGY